MDLKRFEDSVIIEEYQQGKLSYEEKEVFENYLIEKFVLRKLSEKQEMFFGELYFRSQHFFEKVKETEKVALGIKDGVRRGTLDFTNPIVKKFSLLDRLQSFFSTPKLVLVTALLIFAIILPVWQVFQLKSEISNLQRPNPISTESYTLTPIDDALRGETAEIYLTEDDKIFIINFHLTKKVFPGYKYEAQIIDHSRKIIWEIKDLKPIGRYETFTIACYNTTFEEDRYLLKVIELGKEAELTGEEYLYSFRIIK